ncbi:MAG: hypothetical protein D6732_24435 [Methanobacteriota archaeon]|nr:MAG: hypothetical protein D6732_24435 [Euryarchaeota archaeon]
MFETIFEDFFRTTSDTIVPVVGTTYSVDGSGNEEGSIVVLRTPKGGVRVATMLDIRGALQVMSEEEVFESSEMFALRIRPLLKNDKHSIQITFDRDPDKTTRDLEYVFSGSRDTVRRLGMDGNIWIQPEIDYLSGQHDGVQRVFHERCVMVLYTDFEKDGHGSKELKKAEIKERENLAKALNGADLSDGIDLLFDLDDLINTHIGFVEQVHKFLTNDIKVLATITSARDAIAIMRQYLDPENTPMDWKPWLIGDIAPRTVVQKTGEGNLSGLLPPPISDQIFTEPIEWDGDIIKSGGRLYKTMTVEYPQREPRPFNLLMRNIPQDTPLRVSFSFRNGIPGWAEAAYQIAKFVASVSNAKRFVRAIDTIKEIVNNDSDICGTTKIVFMTWADNEDELYKRFRRLSAAVESWGECKVATDRDDPVPTWASVAPFCEQNLKHPVPIVPFSNLSYSMPLFRPCSVWDRGSIVFHSEDGRMLPFEPMSGKQNYWNVIFYAPPGSGKSVLMLNIIMSIVMKPGNSIMPRIGILDIGFTSDGLIQLIRESLPDDKKYLAISERLQNSNKYAINPMDTMLLSRFPLPSEREFIINMLTILATPTGREKPYENTRTIISQAVDMVYRKFADRNTAKRYQRGVNKDVDAALDRIGVKPKIWWDAVEALFDAGDEVTAEIAQRYAVPLVNDVATLIGGESQQLIELWQDTTETGVSLLTAISRNLSAAINDFPVFASHTKFSLSSSKIIALNLEDVISKGDSKQAAIFYMLARHVVAKGFHLDEKEHLSFFPKKYHDYYKRKIREMKTTPSAIVFDEFHRVRAGGQKDAFYHILMSQVKADMREGRKYFYSVMLASQYLDDFDDVILKSASMSFIMKVTKGSEVDEIIQKYRLDPGMKNAILTQVSGAGPGGAKMLVAYEIKGVAGTNTAFATFAVSPHRLFALSTTQEDRELIRMLSEEFNYSFAISFMSRKFPHGSSKDEYESWIHRYSREYGLENTGDMTGVELYFKHVLLPEARKMASRFA